MNLDLSETADGICVHTNDGTVLLTNEQAWEVLEWLYERRDSLYPGQQVRYLPGEVRSMRKRPTFAQNLEKPWLPIQPGEEF